MDILNEDILLKIFEQSNSKEKKRLCEVNKDFNELFTPRLQKYKLITFLNLDYLQFYNYLNKYDYSKDITYIGNIIVRAFMNIPTVWASHRCGMYDLRFVFELMYKGYIIERDHVKIYNLHFYIHFYNKIRDCISSTREQTLLNIEGCPYLFSLKRTPMFRKTTKNGVNFHWVPLLP